MCERRPESRASADLVFERFVHQVLGKGFRRAKIRALPFEDSMNAPATRGDWEYVDFSADLDANKLVYETRDRFDLTPRDHLCCDLRFTRP